MILDETTILVLICCFGPMIILIVYVLAINQINQSARKECKIAYKKALDKFKADPNSVELHEKVLKAGRKLISATNPNQKLPNAFNDVRLSQDVEAARAGATLNVSNKTPDGIAAEIAKLAELCQRGILSGDEFEIGKAYMLGHNKTDELAKKITALHRLQEQGAITEGEFNLKKWDLLAHK